MLAGKRDWREKPAEEKQLGVELEDVTVCVWSNIMLSTARHDMS